MGSILGEYENQGVERLPFMALQEVRIAERTDHILNVLEINC